MQEVRRAGALLQLGLKIVKIFIIENEVHKQYTCGMIIQVTLCIFLMVSLPSSTLACFIMEAQK
jgi:hypothetical protein